MISLPSKASIGLALLSCLFPVAAATAQLTAVGAVNPANGFPASYTDAQGTQLDQCLSNSGLCLLTAAVQLLNPALPFPSNYGGTFPAEVFYWAGSATLPTTGTGQALLIMALEGTFLNGSVIPGDQVVFGRMRIRIDNLVPGATYHITTPYGTFDQVATRTGPRGINFTRDITPIPGNFTAALNSGIGPFLRWDSGLPLIDGLGNSFIGDPNVDHTVTGSPAGTNFFRVDGPNVGGQGINTISTNLFSITGQLGVPAPVASFTAAPTTGVAPLTTVFTNTSTGTITSWAWDFGDGSTSVVQSPSHVYTLPGSYTVSLTVTGPGGSNTSTQLGLVNVTTATLPPVASFTAAPTTGVAPLATVFTDTSTGSVTSWAWNFGDGTVSTLQSPAHSYTTAGTYTVSLTVTGAGGSNTATQIGLITVTPPIVQALTLALPAPGTAGVVNNFTITGCTPGATVTLISASATGTSTITVGGITFRTGLRRPTVLGSAVATGTTVTIPVTISRRLVGTTVRYQALNSTGARTSNVISKRW